MSSYDKDAWRKLNVQFLESRPALWSGGKLKVSYYELVGLSGSKMYDLLADKLHTPKQFIGVDQRTEAVLYHRKNRAPWTTCLVKDGYLKAEQMATYSAAQREQVGIGPYPIAIYGFDDHASVGSRHWWDTEASQLRQIVAKTLEQAEVCCVILNNTLDRNPDRHQAVEEHTRRLCSAFSDWELKEEALLGPSRRFLNRIVESPSGYFGGYQVYKSLDHALRMATVRLEFTKARGVRVWKGA